jgi:hypothetical protein
MRIRPAGRLNSERGATLIHVAIALVSLMGLGAYAVDRGIAWVSRGQAQNAADAGALAGAVARAWDDPADPPALGRAYNAAYNLAVNNLVWNEAGGANVTWTCPTEHVGKRCVRVDVYRNGEFGSNPLPLVLGYALGLSSHGVRATATAIVEYGNTVLCMRPFSVPDKWLEQYGPTDEYNHWITQGGNRGDEILPTHDVYSGPGSGWNADPNSTPNDVGTPLILKIGNNPNSDGESIRPGWSMPVRLPDPNGDYFSGADDYRGAIGGCTSGPVAIGDRLPLENGVMNGPTGQGVDDLIALDPGATFVATPVPHIEGSCAPSCNPYSPRIVPISVFDVEEFQYNQAHGNAAWSASCGSLGRCIKIVQIIGFFVEGMSGGDVLGRIMLYPGEFVSGPSAPMGSEFLVKIQLVR